MQANKIQPSAFRVFKIQEVHKITTTVAFFFVDTDPNQSRGERVRGSGGRSYPDRHHHFLEQNIFST